MKAFKVPPQTHLNVECITCTQPKDDSETITFTDHWKVILHPDQSGLGSCLVAPLRHVPRLCDQTAEEAADFHVLLSVLEPALEKVFGATLINFSCLRNWAYREHNPDPPFKEGRPNPHVHWHVITRYKSPVTFDGHKFTDPTFGEPFQYRGERAKDSRGKVIKRIQSYLPLTFI